MSAARRARETLASATMTGISFKYIFMSTACPACCTFQASKRLHFEPDKPGGRVFGWDHIAENDRLRSVPIVRGTARSHSRNPRHQIAGHFRHASDADSPNRPLHRQNQIIGAAYRLDAS